MNYINFSLTDLGAGIDALSAESQIPEGYSERLLNVDPTPEGYLAKRTGYSSRAGWVPVRINRIEAVAGSPDEHCFYLDAGVDVTTVDLSTARSSPIVVFGKLATDPGTGDFSNTNEVNYYSGFSPETRNFFALGPNTTTLLGTAHSRGPLLFLGLAQSDDQLSNNNTIIHPDTWMVDKTTADVLVSYTNDTASSFEGFIYVSSGAVNPGVTYVDVEAGPVTTVSLPAATHQLSNTNILWTFYQDTGTDYIQVTPDYVEVSATGDVTAGFSSAQTNLVTILKAAPISNVVLDTVAPGQTFVKSFAVEQPFLIVSTYEEDLITGDKLSALPDSISVADGVATVTYTNESATALNFILYFEYGTLATNKLCVTANNQDIAATWESTDVQLTLWGLNHAEIYSSQVEDQRPGWVTHIDNYRAEGTESLVVGLGGNLFTESRDVLPEDIFHPRLRSRIGATTTIGPAFAETSTRSRGYISFTGAAQGYGRGISAEFDALAGMMKYVLNLPGLVVNGTLSTIIHTSVSNPGFEDYVEISQSAIPENSGTFRIADAAVGVDTLTLWVENPAAGTSDFNESDSGMLIGIFSDKLPLLDFNPFLPGDLLSSDLFSAVNLFTVLDAEDLFVSISGVNAPLSVPIGLRVAGSRTSSVIPLRLSDDSPSVYGIVRGDVLSYAPIERLLQVVRVNSLPDTNVSIVGDGAVATVTLGAGDTTGLTMGMRVLITDAGAFTGEQEVTAVISLSAFTFASESAASAAGILVGATIEINETFNFSDSQLNANSLNVPSRWVPIEAPEDNFDLTASTHVSYLNSGSYVAKPIVRSAMANDTMFFTSGNDEVLKFDSENIYRAGLPTWQMQLYSSVDSTNPAIQVNLPSATASALANGSYTVPLGAELAFVAGDEVSITSGGTTVSGVVSKVYDNGTNGLIQISSSQTLPFSVSATINLKGRYRYYFRLNAIDLNDNLIASTVVGSSDFIIEISQSSAINIRLVGLPTFGSYDYDRIEAEIYRTKLNTPQVFYRLATIPVSFNLNSGYIDFTDTLSDDTLTIADLDAVSTALEGAELGNGWSEPLRAQYVTSAAGSLVLGNIKDYPKLSMRIVDTGIPVTTAQLLNKRFLFRKDNLDTITTTNNVDSMAFEFVNTGATITSALYSGSGLVTINAAGTYAIGDWVYLYRAAATPTLSLKLSGHYQVVTAGAGTFQIQTDLLALPAVYSDRVAVASDARDIPVLLGVDGNISIRDGNNFTSTYALLNAIRRLSSAINTSQRLCRTTGFTPWLSAQAGAEFAVGEILISQPLVLSTTMEVLLPAFTEFLIFVNGVKRASAASISTLTQLFPSRVVASFPNFPELFNSPTSPGGTVTQVYDVNPADGQEVTGIIPFFGESVFGASSKGSIVVVFKTNSIYLLDLSGNTIDGSRIQKVDSRGIGCTAPYSIAPTQNGIMFATDSGIYRLKQDLTVEYVGRKLERIWQKEVETNASGRAIMSGHYSPTGNSYKLSIPMNDETKNSSAFIYNTVREYSADGYRMGSWTLYDNHNAVGWANSTSSSFFGSSSGDVLEISNKRSEKPYRDSGLPISATATLRALDFGEASIRKSVSHAVVNYRASDLSPDSGTEVYSSIDLKDQFVQSDSSVVSNRDTPNDGLGSSGIVKIRPIKYSFDRRKGVYFQLQFRNELLDSPMEVTNVSLRVAGLADAGIVSAKESK